MGPYWQGKLIGQEGRRFIIYDDATGKPIRPGTTCKGHPTIGIGRALDTNGLTPAEVDILFADDVGTLEARLILAFPHYMTLSDGRRFVVCSVAFNCGMGGLLGFPAMLAALWSGQWERAAAELLNSSAARELPARYAYLAAILRQGDDKGLVSP